MLVDLVLWVMMVSLATPADVEFLHWMGVLGCGQLIKIRACQRGNFI